MKYLIDSILATAMRASKNNQVRIIDPKEEYIISKEIELNSLVVATQRNSKLSHKEKIE